MENKTIQFVGTSPEELKASLLNLIQPQLEQILKEVKKQNSIVVEDEVLITREQAAKILCVNLSSLWRYTKDGVLKSYSLPNTSRVYYKKSEILGAIK